MVYTSAGHQMYFLECGQASGGKDTWSVSDKEIVRLLVVPLRVFTHSLVDFGLKSNVQPHGRRDSTDSPFGTYLEGPGLSLTYR